MQSFEKKKTFFPVLPTLLLLMVLLCTGANASDTLEFFNGCGTRDDPYLIESYQDIRNLSRTVEDGERFENCYFLQTDDIDMENMGWFPIGTADSPFAGVYDGNGHSIRNLLVTYESAPSGVSGLFGYVSGAVINLGIESGWVEGTYCGSIGVQSVGENAAIINCYSRASVEGGYAGGIAYNFAGNLVACSWYDGTLNGSESNCLVATGGDIKIYHCYSTTGMISTEDVDSPTSAVVEPERLFSSQVVRNLNLSVGLAQFLFAGEYGVNLKEWKLDANGSLTYSDGTGYLRVFRFIDLYLLPLLLLCIALIYFIKWMRYGSERFCERYHKDAIAIAIVSGVVAFFFDMALIAKGKEVICAGNILFMVVLHTFLIIALKIVIKKKEGWNGFRKEYIPLLCAIAVVVVLELIQFQLVPHFDAHLYYGSFVKGCQLFRADLLTYIGDFVCWKWAQGLVLLIAPFEFLLPGKMIGVYVSNVIITVVTMCCSFWLLRQLSPGISPILAALSGAILMLCPYELGLFTYLCMDNYTALFLVWLLCSYKAKQPILVSFCGYLLAFNKITGLVFYVFFLLSVGMYEVFSTQEKSFFRKVLTWWDWKKVSLWVFPAVVYLCTTVVADDLTVLCFYGSYTEASIGIKNLRGLANTGMQAFVYGFRWIFTLLTIFAAALLLLRRRKLTNMLKADGCAILAATVVGCAATLVVLCIYRGDAECPRYTALLNVYYAIFLPIVLQLIFSRRKALVAECILAGLLLIQLFCTIDPVILLTCDSIDTGKKQIYKLAVKGDERVAMNLGIDYGRHIEVLGDLYVYNLEHTFYDDLLDQMLTDIEPTEDTQFVLLDVIDYELHMYGNHYRIYWDAERHHRTYDGISSSSIFLKNERNVTTDMLVDNQVELDPHFYLIVPARVDADEAIAAIQRKGYDLNQSKCYSNVYGKLFVYEFSN